MFRRTRFKVIVALALLLTTFAVAMVLATADSLETPLRRDNLTVHMLNVSGARIYLVERDGKRIMIDSGNPGDEVKIERFMRDAGMAPQSIDYLIITHGHLDHVGTARYFQERYGIKVIGGTGDAKMFSEGIQQPLCATGGLAMAIDMGLRGKTYTLFDADILIEDEFDLDQLGFQGSIIPIPGHTEGSLLVTFDEVVFVGDLIRGEVFRPGTPTRHFFMCDLADNDADIHSVLNMNQLEYWFPGHFGPLRKTDIARNLPGK
jgi:hydroxyacylglutathione hydrolase